MYKKVFLFNEKAADDRGDSKDRCPDSKYDYFRGVLHDWIKNASISEMLLRALSKKGMLPWQKIPRLA